MCVCVCVCMCVYVLLHMYKGYTNDMYMLATFVNLDSVVTLGIHGS